MTGTELPVLEPERIVRMRAHVMDTIRDDHREAYDRRRRRTRRILGGSAAAVVVVVLGGVGWGAANVLPALGPQGASDYSVSDDSAGGSAVERDLDGDANAGADSDAEPPFTDTVITSGSVALEVEDTQDALDGIRAWTATHDGRIDAENVSDDDGSVHADVTVRVPGEEVEELRRALGDLGTLEAVDVQRADVAAQVADVEARIDSLRASIERLRAIIAESASTKDLLEAETQLSQRQAELESLQAQRRVLHDETSLATIQVTITQHEEARVTPWGYGDGLSQGWNALVATLDVAVTVAGVLTPWLLPVAAAAAAIMLVRRRARQH